MVCEKLSLIANNIKNQVEDESDFPIEVIKQPELQDFKMLDYDQVPGYDPSEGIKLIIKYIHPKDHPSYPHYCYPVYEVEYANWLKETSVFTVEQYLEIPIGNDIRPEICACVPRYCYERDCNYSENNPVCPGHPRCNGCNYMFYYDLIEEHLKDNPICYETYSQQTYNELLERVKKVGAAKEKIRLENHKAYITREWNKFKEHFEYFSDITWRDLEKPSRRHYHYIEKEWEKIQKGLLNSIENESSEDSEKWDEDTFTMHYAT